MPKRIPLQTIVIVREGKRIVPELGKAFDFTSAELKSINEVSPGALRAPINESPVEVEAKAAPAAAKEAAAPAAKEAAPAAAAKADKKAKGDEAL